jgi:hypothetical protein
MCIVKLAIGLSQVRQLFLINDNIVQLITNCSLLIIHDQSISFSVIFLEIL